MALSVTMLTGPAVALAVPGCEIIPRIAISNSVGRFPAQARQVVDVHMRTRGNRQPRTAYDFAMLAYRRAIRDRMHGVRGTLADSVRWIAEIFRPQLGL